VELGIVLNSHQGVGWVGSYIEDGANLSLSLSLVSWWFEGVRCTFVQSYVLLVIYILKEALIWSFLCYI